VLPLEVDPTLNRLTFYLVMATLVLAVGTLSPCVLSRTLPTGERLIA